MTKFSEELIAVQMAMLLVTSTVAAYLLLVRKKKREGAEWVPAALVRAYLDRMRTDERETRLKLFGEQSPAYATSSHVSTTTMLSAGVDPSALKEVEALRAQLTLADQRAMEFDRMMNGLRAEKTGLEQKLKEAQAAPGAAAAGGAPSADTALVQKEMEELKARLQEYEVIEDDLANLKKFQKENETLRAKVQQYEAGGAVVSGAPAAAETKTVISGAAAPAPAPVTIAAAPAAEEPKPAVADTNTNVLAPVTPTVDTGAAAPEKTSQQKEEELLSEFEKMLAS